MSFRRLMNLSKPFYQQHRSAWMFRRVHQPLPLEEPLENNLIVGPAVKKILPEIDLHPDDGYLYEVIKYNKPEKQLPIDVILLKDVKGLGVAGDIVPVHPNYLRYELILNHEATYATELNKEIYRKLIDGRKGDSSGPSSVIAAATAEQLATTYVLLTMNGAQAWTINRKHVRIALREEGFIVPESSIELPEMPISGPDVDGKENKDFIVHITINNHERVPVRCVIHHSTVPYLINWKNKSPRIAIIPEQQNELDTMFTFEAEAEKEDDDWMFK